MTIREALFNYYHMYKDNLEVYSRFTLYSYLADVCQDNLVNKADLIDYKELLSKIDVFQILIDNGIEEGFNKIKAAPLYKKVISNSKNKYLIFYTLHMFDETLVDISMPKESLKKMKVKVHHNNGKQNRKSKTVKPTSAKKPNVVKHKKASSNIPNKNIVDKRPVYYTKAGRLMHLDPRCFNTSSAVLQIGLYDKVAQNKNLCPYCAKYKSKYNEKTYSSIRLNKALYNAISDLGLFSTVIGENIFDLEDKLILAGPDKEVRFHHFVFKYTRVLNLFYKLSVRLAQNVY